MSYYGVLWATMTNYDPTYSHYELLWANITRNLLNHIIWTKYKVARLFIFLKLVPETHFVVKFGPETSKGFVLKRISVNRCWFWIRQLIQKFRLSNKFLHKFGPESSNCKLILKNVYSGYNFYILKAIIIKMISAI